MKEKKEKQLKDTFEWLLDKDTNFFDLEDAFENPIDFKIITELFGEKQAKFYKALIKKLSYIIFEWHNKNDGDSHEDLRTKLSKLDAHLRNHRHDYSKAFSGKAEY